MDTRLDYSWINSLSEIGWLLRHLHEELYCKKNTGLSVRCSTSMKNLSITSYHPRESTFWVENFCRTVLFLENIKLISYMLNSWETGRTNMLNGFCVWKYDDFTTWISQTGKAPCVISYALTNLILCTEIANCQRNEIRYTCMYCQLIGITAGEFPSLAKLLNHGIDHHLHEEKNIPMCVKNAINFPRSIKLSTIIINAQKDYILSLLKNELKNGQQVIQRCLFKSGS